MSIEKSGSVRNNASSRRLAFIALSFVLLSGLLHATPIVTLESVQPQDSHQLASQGAVSASLIKTGFRSAAVATAPVISLENKSFPGTTTGCAIGDCSKTVEVPEPQSLLLVGTGLLSMAGMIRRRRVAR